MNELLVNWVIFCVYIFTIVPAVGLIFTGGYKSYGKYNPYIINLIKGCQVHFIFFMLCLVLWAIYYKFNY